MGDDTDKPQPPQEKDAMLEEGQADYGSAGQQAVEGVNKAREKDKE
ncbi:MAG TPA: hypothetical protein VF649_13420 [Sphingomonas sp.]